MAGSGYKVALTTIKAIRKHPNADKLEIATVYGFDVIVTKDSCKVGDQTIYVPIESVLPSNLESRLFPEDSKIKLSKSRIRQIRIRKYPSQGMLILPSVVYSVYGFTPDELEKDYAKKLGIEKYEVPARQIGAKFGTIKKKNENPHFSKYGGLENIKWVPDLFKDGETVIVTEKLHGSNGRVGIQPFVPHTLWDKAKKLFGLTPKWMDCYGSNNVQLQEGSGDNLYKRVFDRIGIFDKLSPGETVYGEIVGQGIQKNYHYGCEPGEYKFVVFDVKRTENGIVRWLSADEVDTFCKNRRLDSVPILFEGEFSIEKIKELTLGNSVFAPSQKVREGIVIKPKQNNGSKKALKMISEKYLDKDQSEFS